MCHCITPQALLSGLVLRASREGYAPTREDLASLFATGCRREDVIAAIERMDPIAAERLRRALASVDGP